MSTSKLWEGARCALAAIALAAAGCSNDSDVATVIVPTLPPGAGATLVVHWTIGGVADPNLCVQTAAPTFELAVTDFSGRGFGVFDESCTTFTIVVTLPPGGFQANGVLIDPSGIPRTTFVPIDPFTLNANETLDIAVDFPLTSFF